jgi:hypothetical protein
MGIDSHLSTCVGTQSPKYLEMAQGHISLSKGKYAFGLFLSVLVINCSTHHCELTLLV